MEIKKSPKADLEGKRFTWLLVGYVIVLAFMFIAFEWTEREKVIDMTQAVSDVVFVEEMIPITMPEDVVAPPPSEAPQVTDVIEIVEDDVEVEENVVIQSDVAAPITNVTYVAVPTAVVVEETNEDEIFETAENMPEFPGGNAALMQFLQKNIRYPQIPQENGVQGRVIIQFVVNTDGTVVDPVVARSVDPYLDKEALRVIGLMPKWKPGMQRNKPVRVKYTVPVVFRLQ